MAQEPGQKRGPETDVKDRGRLKRLERAVHDIMGSDAFLEALEEARTDGRALAELKANPKAHLGRKGIGIPEEVEVEFSEESPWCVYLCYYWWWYRFCCSACI